MFHRIGAAATLVLLLACAPAAPAPTAAPPKPAAKAAEAKPAEAKPAAKAAEKPAAKAPEAWEQEWERTLAAARQEGKVAVTGPAGVESRDALTDPFVARYGIQVDFFGGSGRDITPRVSAARAAGVYEWDVYVSGTTTALGDLIPAGALDPMESALILPDVKDPKSWRGGELEFLEEKRLLVMTPTHTAKMIINPNIVSVDEFKSFKDLLDPKWKGKILSDDPRSPGAGQATWLFFHLHPELGPNYIRALAGQDLTFSRDHRQMQDLVARGNFPLMIGPSDGQAENRSREGLPIHLMDPRQFRELSDVTPSNGSVALYNRPPHPNAAKLYVNWVLSQEGQTTFARAQRLISSRLDVPTDHTYDWRIPQPGAIKTYTVEAQVIKDREMLPLLNEVLGRQ